VINAGGFRSLRSGAAPGQLHVVPADGSMRGLLRVEHADPRIWLTNQLVTELRAGRCSEHVRYQERPGGWPAGAVLTVDAVNRRVVYVLREYLDGPDCWLAEWPD
jgi:hypothetical protein